MKRKVDILQACILILLFLLSGRPLFAEQPVTPSYLYTLSNFTGIVPLSWVKITVDEPRGEAYVLTGPAVKIFNENGMEIGSFNDNGELGSIRDVVVDSEGNVFVLRSGAGNHFEIIRCNYRGEPVSPFELKNIPQDFDTFNPDRMIYRSGSIYIASQNEMKVIVVDSSGIFKAGYDIQSLIEPDLQDKADGGFTALSVDREGNIFFTVSALARAYKLSPDNRMTSFGRRGSSAGKFGVPAGIVADATGKYVLVADTLRSVVIVFDSNFRFYAEFGFRGNKPGNLVGPMYMAVDGNNKLYVSQLRNRGVNVYQISPS